MAENSKVSAPQLGFTASGSLHACSQIAFVLDGVVGQIGRLRRVWGGGEAWLIAYCSGLDKPFRGKHSLARGLVYKFETAAEYIKLESEYLNLDDPDRENIYGARGVLREQTDLNPMALRILALRVAAFKATRQVLGQNGRFKLAHNSDLEKAEILVGSELAKKAHERGVWSRLLNTQVTGP